jgi:hypothetical protein
MNTKNFVGKLNMITIKMMGKEFIISLMCFNDIIQTYGDHSLLFSKELFFSSAVCTKLCENIYENFCVRRL